VREVFYPSFAHIYGIVAGLLLPAWVGCYVMVMKQYDFLPYVKRCSEIRATVLRLVPATAIRLVKDPDVRGLGLASVKTVMCSGAALAIETVKELQGILDPEAAVLNGYGMSETTVMIQRETRTDKPGSVGKPAAGVSVRLVDDDGRDVLPGQDGECLVQGPTVFMHYKNNPIETQESFVGPWLRTGDILRADEEGFFWLTGRKKELIKYKGNQVAPAELEDVLLGHPLVSDAGVCGIYDKEAETETPAACVVLAEEMDETGQRQAIDSIRNYVDERVAPYKKLRGGLYAVKELPKGSTGKLLRRELPARIEEYKRLCSKL
jgi:4-coumarate--CoA ligase